MRFHEPCVLALLAILPLNLLQVVGRLRSEPCIGCPTVNPDVTRNVSQLIESRGYTVEEHYAVTKDGFILNMQRIPRGRNDDVTSEPKPVVFLQHGLLADASSFVLNEHDNSMGYVLADSGFDVWLGNIRGNRYSRSRRGERYSPKDWNWSWDEMAAFDLPAMIDYVLDTTKQAQLSYVGHSQGTLIGFTGFSSNPQLAKKLNLFVALAPIYFLHNVSAVFRDLAYALFPLEEWLQNFSEVPFLPGTLIRRLISVGMCGGKYSEKFCYDLAETLFGFDDADANMTRVPVLFAHWPSGTSFKNIIHYGQVVVHGKCQKFDYSRQGNIDHYGQPTPPLYNVSEMATPTVFFTGAHDTLSSPSDVQKLKPLIENLQYFEEFPNWNHFDFLTGIDAKKLLFPKVIKLLQKAASLGNTSCAIVDCWQSTDT